MNSEQIKFEYTPQIKRYLGEITNYWNEMKQDMPKHQIKFADPLIIKTYLSGDILKKKNDISREEFMKWIKKEGVIEIVELGDIEISPINETEYAQYPEYFSCHVINITPIVELQNMFSEKVINSESKDNGCLIFYEEGNERFICGTGSKRLPLKFDKSKPYYDFMSAIYLSTGGHGETTVSEINRILKNKFNYKKDVSRKNIQNHINNSIKRKLRGKSDTSSVFQWIRGTNTLFFNNEKVDIKN